MHFTRAIARTPGLDFAQGLTESTLGPPDPQLARQQHEAYCETLKSLGLAVTVLPPEPGLPDCTFVEDTAVVIPGGAVITRPGSDARRPETRTMKAVLKSLPVSAGISTLHHVDAPGTVEGGDVMEVDGHFYIGISKRTNEEGARQLGSSIVAAGGGWTMVQVVKELHLKTSVNYLGNNTLLMTEPFAQLPEFEGFRKVVISEEELPAANCIRIGDTLLMTGGYPEVRARIETLGIRTMELDMSEFTKMDGGLSCLSIRL